MVVCSRRGRCTLSDGLEGDPPRFTLPSQTGEMSLLPRPAARASTRPPGRRLLALGVRAARALKELGSCTSPGYATYLGRFVRWGPPAPGHVHLFPSRGLAPSAVPRRYETDAHAAARLRPVLREITYARGGIPITIDLDRALEESGTTAFLIIKDRVLLREDYAAGHDRGTPTRAYSVSKSYTAALVGAAIADGHLRGADDRLVEHLPELGGRGYDEIRLRHLLRMTSGIGFTWGAHPGADVQRLRLFPDVRRLILAGPPVVAPPGERFQYGDWSSLVLAMVVERAAGTTFTEYLARRIWGPMGAEHAATFSMDHAGDGLEYAHTGLNACPVDLVKLASAYLESSRENVTDVVPPSWVEVSMAPGEHPLPGHSEAEERTGTTYGHGWWCHRPYAGDLRYFAHGYAGQLVYVRPSRHVIVARFGTGEGRVGEDWPMLLSAIAERVP